MAKQCSEIRTISTEDAFVDAIRNLACGYGIYNADIADLASPANSGAGTVSGIQPKEDAETETITLTANSPPTTFAVSGSVSGAIGTATVDTPFTSTVIDLTINSGSPAFQAGDGFVFSTTVGQMAIGQLDDAVAGSSNVGAGTVSGLAATKSTVDEVITLTANSPPTTFAVSGSVSGSLGTATVGVQFSHAKCVFTINDGSPDFASGDTFTIASFAPRPWTLNEYNSGAETEAFLQGQGLAGDDEIYISMKTYSGSGGDGNYYNVRFDGAIGYDVASDFGAQASSSNAEHQCAIALDLSSMTLWVSANGQCIYGTVKVQNTYHPFYLGFLDRAGTVGQYPLPLAIGGSTPGDANASYSSRWSASIVRSPFDPIQLTSSQAASLVVRHITGWAPGRHWTNNETHVTAGTADNAYVTPYGRIENVLSTVKTEYINVGVGGKHKLTRLGVFVHEVGCLGWFDGCFHVTGDSNTVESSGTLYDDNGLNGVTHRCFSQGSKAGNGDYYCQAFPNEISY